MLFIIKNSLKVLSLFFSINGDNLNLIIKTKRKPKFSMWVLI